MMRHVGRTILAAIWLLAAFNGGMWCQRHWFGEARIFTNIDEHTPLNHGQKSVEITLPDGVTFSNFGECGPQWHAHHADDLVNYWRSATINVEKWDPETHAFVRVPDRGRHWVEIDEP